MKPGRAVHKAGRMNKLEAAFAQHLQRLQQAGEILYWLFEPMKLNLTGSGWLCTYTPDFLAVAADGTMELYEVKGHWEDDARVKVRVAADRFPFRFIGVTRVKGVWQFESFCKEDGRS